MSEILVGVDGTPSAEDALAFAQRLASATGASLRLATVFPYSDTRSRASSEPFRAALRAESEAILDRAAAGLESDVSREIVADVSPPHALHRLAEETGAALVVVGSTHRGPVGSVLPGSTGERLLHGSSCPVAIVPHGYASRDAEIVTVAVGYDGLDESEAALTATCELARRIGARVRVIRVFDAARDATPALVPGVDYLAIEKETEEIERAQLRRRVEALGADVEAEAVFATGAPGPVLAAEAAAVDVLVVGSRGYGPLRAVLLGGVSHAVVRKAQRPVIVLPRGAEKGLDALFAPTAETSA
jgi:nucleotide-binding universal stress UspA family protein